MKEVASISVTTVEKLQTFRRTPSLILERYYSRWKKRLPTTIVEGLTDIFAYPIYVEGVENLEATQGLIEKGKKLEMWPNHLSYIDPLVIMSALKKAGHREIAENTTSIEGLRLGMNPIRKFLASGYETIRVKPSSIRPKNREERSKFLEMNKQALSEAMAALKNGRHLLMFPEGTRSRTLQLEKGAPGVERYLNPERNPQYIQPEDIFVLPIGVWGTEKILPVGGRLPDGHAANVSFGEPRPVIDALKHFEHSNGITGKMIVDYFMSSIADCLPWNYQGGYAKTYVQT